MRNEKGQFVKGHHASPETQFKKGCCSDERNLNWKGGISKTEGYRQKIRKKHRKFEKQQRKARIRGGGKLSIKTIQLIYEDNIKKYGTLTCYLCEMPIEFKKDHLEHKTPLSRGGNNLYENLAIACQKCNCMKHCQTEQEFRKEQMICLK